MHPCRSLRSFAFLWALVAFAQGTPAFATPTLELYGNFHTMGVIIHLSQEDDPDEDALAHLEYRLTGDDSYAAGFPPSRIADTRFVGSLFRLEPDSSYDIRVIFDDPDGPLDGFVLEGTGATRPEVILPAPLRSLFVSPQGTGSECAEDNPCSLTDALAIAQAGDELVLRGGTYHVGGYEIYSTGSEEEPIVMRGYEGETAILDGSDPESFAWTSIGNGVYRTTLNVPDTHLVLADGQRLFPYGSLEDLDGLVWDGAPGFYCNGLDLYVHLENDADPASVAMTIARENFAFFILYSHFAFLDLTFRHYGQGDWSKCIYLFDADDCLVRDCRFVSNDLGIGIKYDANRNLIEGCEFSDTIFDWSWDGVKQEDHLEDGGITFYEPCTGRGNVIRRNIFHDDFDGMHVCPAVLAGVTNETDVYENICYRLGDDGMETDGQCSNVRIWDNTFHDVLMGISLAPAYDGPVFVLRNLIYRTGVGNNVYTGSPFKFNSGYSQSGRIFLFHNTCDAVLPGNNGLYVKAPGSWKGIVARNNIWYGTAYAIENYNTVEPIDLDFDDVTNDDIGDLVRWESTNYATLESFAQATGQESHGLSVSPQFVDRDAGDFTLGSGSGLIDAGVLIPGINDDYSGEAPDIGAFEAEPSGSGADSGDIVHGRWVTCHPNPFRDTVSILSTPIGNAEKIEATIFDLNGRRMRTLAVGHQRTDGTIAIWDGYTDTGKRVAPGLYFVQVRIDQVVTSLSTIVLR